MNIIQEYFQNITKELLGITVVSVVTGFIPVVAKILGCIDSINIIYDLIYKMLHKSGQDILVRKIQRNDLRFLSSSLWLYIIEMSICPVFVYLQVVNMWNTIFIMECMTGEREAEWYILYLFLILILVAIIKGSVKDSYLFVKVKWGICIILVGKVMEFFLLINRAKLLYGAIFFETFIFTVYLIHILHDYEDDKEYNSTKVIRGGKCLILFLIMCNFVLKKDIKMIIANGLVITWIILTIIEFFYFNLYRKKVCEAVCIQTIDGNYWTMDNVKQYKNNKIRFRTCDDKIIILDGRDIIQFVYEEKLWRTGKKRNTNVLFYSKREEQGYDGYKILNNNWIRFWRYEGKNKKTVILKADEVKRIG